MFSVFAIFKAAFIFDSQMWEPFHHSLSEESRSRPDNFPLRGELFRIFDSAGRRSPFQNKPIYHGERIKECSREYLHFSGEVPARSRLEQDASLESVNHTDGVAGDAETDLRFRTYGDAFDLFPEFVHELIGDTHPVIAAAGKSETPAEYHTGFD